MENTNVLMVTRDLESAGFCAAAFKGAPVDFSCVCDHKKFRAALKAGFDAILLDISGLPELTGFKTPEEGCSHLRRLGRQKVIIAMSPKVLPPREVVSILGSGANDVISGEWRFRVIAEQVKALINFAASTAKKTRNRISLEDNSVAVDLAMRRCFALVSPGVTREVSLTRNEFRILALLVSRKGELVSYGDFRDRLWPDRLFQAEIKHALLQHITDLRKKLGAHGPRIENVWGEGFRIS